MRDFRTIRITDCGGNSQLAWAEGECFCLPASLLGDSSVFECVDSDGHARLARDATVEAQAAAEARLQHAFTETPPLSARLPFSYQAVPAPLRSAIARVIAATRPTRGATRDDAPLWPLDLSADFLADLAAEPRRVPAGPTPVVLSHDLDSREGLDNLLADFLPIEEAAGARSTSYLVPFKWQIDESPLQEIAARGHELGVHGYDHANRTPFLDPARMIERIAAASELVDRYDMRGYRAPSLLRTRRLLEALSRFYQYDSSIPTSGGLFPVPNNGCASARPFWISSLLELPLSLPRDGSLLLFGCEPRAILGLWMELCERIADSGGVVVLLTHCERRFSGRREMVAVYREFLEYIAASDRFTWRTARQVVEQVGSSRHGGVLHGV